MRKRMDCWRRRFKFAGGLAMRPSMAVGNSSGTATRCGRRYGGDKQGMWDIPGM